MATKEEILNFSLEIEKIATDKSCSYMDAVVLYCENTGVEVEVAAKLISTALKCKIREEAEKLNCIEKSNTSQLPV